MFGAVWKRFNWLSEIVIPGVAAAMTAAWLTPLIYLLLHNLAVSPEGPAFPAGLIMALLLGGTLLDRLLRAQPGGRVRGLVVGLLVTIGVNALLYGFEPSDPGGWLSSWFAAIIDFDAGIHPALLTIPLTAALWAGGMAVGWEEYETIWTGFRWGVAGLAVCLVLTPYVAAEAMGDLATAVVAFLGWGLLALALRSVARALHVEKPADGHAGLSRQWLVVVTLVIAVLVLGGWMLGQAAFLGVVKGLLAILWPAVRWLLELVAYVLAGILYLFALLLTPLTNAERAETAALRPTFEVTTDLAGQVQQLSESSGNVSTNTMNPGIIVVAIVALVTVVLLILAWRRRRRPRPNEIMESRDSVWTPELLLEQWRSLWRRRPRASAAEPFLALEGGGRYPPSRAAHLPAIAGRGPALGAASPAGADAHRSRHHPLWARSRAG